MRITSKTPYEDAYDAVDRGMSNVEQAALRVRGKMTPPVPDNAEYARYMTLRENPSQLFKFVSRGMGTQDPARVQRGAADYLNEMRKRFGER